MEYDMMSAEMHFLYLLNSELLKLQKYIVVGGKFYYVHVHCYFNFVIIGDLYVTKRHAWEKTSIGSTTIIFVIDQNSQNVVRKSILEENNSITTKQ